MSREIAVAGAGIVGVSIAWHLQRRGHRVLLLDRRPPGQETSFGNAGMIQRASVRPYAFPRDLASLLRVLPNREVDIRYRMSGMLAAALPLLGYWRNSAPDRYDRILPEYASLIGECLNTHGPMIEAAGAESLVRRDGWLQAHRGAQSLQAAIAEAEEDAERFGVGFEALDGEALARREPGLQQPLAGAIHWPDPWTVEDPGALVAAYAASFQAQGGEFMQASLEGVEPVGERWQLRSSAGSVDAEAVVMAFGPWTSQWTQALELSLPLFVKRGYHMHYRQPDAQPLGHWLLDAEMGYVLAPMRAGVRLTTGAELDRLEAPARYGQLDAAERCARELLPLGERVQQTPWMGARPCTPDMKPIIGNVPGKPGLWLACGHCHQGLTMGPATGHLLAQMIDGEPTDIDMQPFRVDRFG
jgi:D-amino-acid dehydrogenase